jgi:ABC-2 type transport system ATP-binding protein/lipopolysaccharide transport system ATP-binding protein
MPCIKLDRVSVAFPIYSSGNRSIKNAVIAATTGGRIANEQKHVVIQALDDVSLEIGHGDRVGLIGHNGAGKTTLLRVMAGIYEPPQGEVTIEGAVTPMFDTGLGIDIESTGYENITLRGLYMGLSKAEIARRMDSIVEFTELGEFLSLPVRTYSAGMQARLTFAIATSIEPEILLLDEGIGVGDADFLEKANKRLASFVKDAGILVLASHSQNLIEDFCNKAAIMEHGRITWYGDVAEGFRIYNGAPAGAASPAAAVADATDQPSEAVGEPLPG